MEVGTSNWGLGRGESDSGNDVASMTSSGADGQAVRGQMGTLGFDSLDPENDLVSRVTGRVVGDQRGCFDASNDGVWNLTRFPLGDCCALVFKMGVGGQVGVALLGLLEGHVRGDRMVLIHSQ